MTSRYLYALIYVILAACVHAVGQATPRQAVVINSSASQKVLLYYKNVLLDQAKHTLSPQDTVRVAFDANSFFPVFISTPVGRNYGLGFLAMPGDTIRIRYNKKDGTYDFSGSHKRELALMKQAGFSSFSLAGPYNQLIFDEKSGFGPFLEEWHAVQAESEAFIKELNAAPGVREEIRSRLEQDIRLRVFSLLLLPAVLQKPKMPVPLYPPAYQDSVAAYAGILQAGKLLPEHTSERLVAALRGYTMYLSGRVGSYGTLARQYAEAKKIYTGQQREWACYSVLKDMAKNERASADLQDDYLAWTSPGSKYHRRLLGLQQLNEVALFTEAAIRDVLLTRDNRQLPLADLLAAHKGKIIYVDLWASWCMPCLVELPSASELSDIYDPADFTVVYLSIDQDVEKWRKALDKYLGGSSDSYRFREWATSGLTHKFGITSIPRYMIIDRAGTVRYADAPKPSSPLLREILDELTAPGFTGKH